MIYNGGSNNHHIHLSKIQFNNTFKYINQLGKLVHTAHTQKPFTRLCVPRGSSGVFGVRQASERNLRI